MSLVGKMVRRLVRSPKRTAVIDDQGEHSDGRIVLGAYHLARLIRRETSNAHVGLMLPTSAAFPMALLGCWLQKRVAVPINYLLSPSEMQHVIADSGIDTLVTVGQMLDHVDTSGIADHIKLIKLDQRREEMKGLPPLRWPANPGDEDLAVVLYTSGTSGKPKGVMLSHGNLEANVRQISQHAARVDPSVFLGVLPQFHSFGLTALTLWPLCEGKRVIYTARFNPRKVVELLKEHKPDVFVGVPSMYGALLSVKSLASEDLASVSLPISGGEPLSNAVAESYDQRLGVTIFEGYGLTETSPVTHCSLPDRKRAQSVGQALPGVRSLVVDESANVLGPDEEGEILLGGPNLMKGYYQLPDLTAEVITELTPPGEQAAIRMFRTGDMGKIDSDGYLYITGRKKEMLIISGENVFPREIEEVLDKHPRVAASAVIGKPDTSRGEVPIAFVELAEDDQADAGSSPFDADEARQFMRQHLPPYKVPKEVHVLEALPRSPTGKVLRRALREE